MKKLLVLGSLLFMMTSCATIMNGTTKDVRFISKNNSEIVIKDAQNKVVARGKGAVTATLPKGANFSPAIYTIEAGDEKFVIRGKVNINEYIIGNSGNMIGWIVDGINGAMFDLNLPDALEVK
ncbi:MAG: hypothetical protein ACTTIS_01885 [Streptobacillus sp.]